LENATIAAFLVTAMSVNESDYSACTTLCLCM